MTANALLEDDQEWFWVPEWLEGELAASEETAAGVLPIYDDIEAMFADVESGEWVEIPFLAESGHGFSVATDAELDRCEGRDKRLSDEKLLADAAKAAADARVDGFLIANPVVRDTVRELRDGNDQAWLVDVEGVFCDEVAAGARRVLDEIERFIGGDVPVLRRHVAEELSAARRRGDDDQQRVNAALAILRPILNDLAELDADELTEEAA